MKLSILAFFLGALPAFGAEHNTETLDGRSGLFRLLSADLYENHSYHFRTSLEYLQQDGLLKDADDSSVKNTRATLAFGFALTPHILLSANGGFNIASRTPRTVGTTSGTESIDLIRGGLAATGVYDVSPYFNWPARRLSAGFSLWIDFSKITRFIEGPNIIPTAIFTSDFTDNQVAPVRTHLNFGFRPANGNRFYTDSAVVKDYDRFVTDTLNSWAWTTGLGFEFPFNYITPSVELHMIKAANTSLSNTPKWVTVGLKGKPFNTQNIEIFGGADIGLSSFQATPAGRKPDAPVVPLWNAVLGFAVSQFGMKEGEVTVSQAEFKKLKNTAAEQETIIQGLKKDLEYNVVQGRVIDGLTKLPMAGIQVSFPENPDIKSSKTDSDGRFIRYFKALTGARLVVSEEGYESSSKFLVLKPGERVTVDIELRKAAPGEQMADFVATVANENGAGVTAQVTLTNVETAQTTVGSSDASGQVSLKVLEGNYRLELKAPGMKTISETLEFQRGKTVLRSYSLSPETAP